MGLDIYHCKATLQRPPTKNPYLLDGITEEAFNGFNVPFIHFHRYIQQIDTAHILQTCILVKEEKYLAETIAWFSDKEDDCRIFFEKDKRTLVRQINAFAAQKKLGIVERHLEEGPEKWRILNYYEIIKRTGFYTTDEGYQRKGVNADFYKRFYSDELYCFALKEDFDYAYNCIDHYWESDSAETVSLRKKLFKENFVDTFEDGASYLHVSY